MFLNVDTMTVARGHGAPAAQQGHATWPGRHVVAAWYGAFAIYAGAVAVFTGHEDRAWAAWAVGSYALTALLLRFGRHWWPALAMALAGGLVAPFTWLATRERATAEVEVIGRSASHLLRYGTPYLPASQLSAWTSYNPYLPVMEVFGLPRSLGVRGLLGDPRLWTSVITIALIAIAFAVMAPHGVRGCRSCRGSVARLTALSVASPVIAFPLALGITDPPVIALLLLALAFLYRGWLARAALTIAAASAMKYTAWPAVGIFVVMLWVRYAPRVAARFAVISVGLTGLLAVLAAPMAMAQPDAVVQNTVAYPLGITPHKTPAASPLPGHLLSELGGAGHMAAIILMVTAAVAFGAWVLFRPPRTTQDVTWRLAVGFAAMITLDPATRFGYYAYPLALLGWLALSHGEPLMPVLSRHGFGSRFPPLRRWLRDTGEL